jgi:hypothetical protein
MSRFVWEEGDPWDCGSRVQHSDEADLGGWCGGIVTLFSHFLWLEVEVEVKGKDD